MVCARALAGLAHRSACGMIFGSCARGVKSEMGRAGPCGQGKERGWLAGPTQVKTAHVTAGCFSFSFLFYFPNFKSDSNSNFELKSNRVQPSSEFKCTNKNI